VAQFPQRPAEARAPRTPIKQQVQAFSDERPDSDIDLLVDLAENRGFRDYLALVEELESLLGRRVYRHQLQSRMAKDHREGVDRFRTTSRKGIFAPVSSQKFPEILPFFKVGNATASTHGSKGAEIGLSSSGWESIKVDLEGQRWSVFWRSRSVFEAYRDYDGEGREASKGLGHLCP
jgi:hypothetical protein